LFFYFNSVFTSKSSSAPNKHWLASVEGAPCSAKEVCSWAERDEEMGNRCRGKAGALTPVPGTRHHSGHRAPDSCDGASAAHSPLTWGAARRGELSVCSSRERAGNASLERFRTPRDCWSLCGSTSAAEDWQVLEILARKERRHDLPSSLGSRSQRPSQGAGTLLPWAREPAEPPGEGSRPVPPASLHEEPLEQGHSGSPTLPASALTQPWAPDTSPRRGTAALLHGSRPRASSSRCATDTDAGRWPSAGSQHPFWDTAASSVTGSGWIAAAATLIASSRLCCSSN